MAGGLSQKDMEFMQWLGQLRLLTVEQLSALTGRSRQVIRRRARFLKGRSFIQTRQRSYGQKRGRPEEIITLSECGWKKFLKNNSNGKSKNMALDSPSDSNFIEHELLVNWVFIHLMYIEKTIDWFSFKFQIAPPYSMNQGNIEIPDIPDKSPIKILDKEFFEFVPDGVMAISNTNQEKTLLFFLEVDMNTEILASPKRTLKDIRQKIINYQALFKSSQYKTFEKSFQTEINGFRLLFVANSDPRLRALCKLTQQMPPSEFIWLTDQDRMFSNGLSSSIWFKGGNLNGQPQSILGERLSCNITVMDKIR